MAINRDELLDALRAYIANDVLEGKDVGLTHTTPLLEWGIINSLEMMKLLTFLEERFHVTVPAGQVVAAHFKDLDSIADLVVRLSSAP